MIQYDLDGATLFYVTEDGLKVKRSPLDGASYSAMVDVLDQQIEAARENTNNVDAYKQALANAQLSVGLPGFVVPVKPMQKNVSDKGVITLTAFNPPLADIVPLNVQGTGTNTIRQETVDIQALDHAMITAIYRKMFPAS